MSTTTRKSTSSWRSWPDRAKKDLLDKLRPLVASRVAAAPNPLLTRLKEDPARLMEDAGMPPDPWQAAVLRSSARRLLLLAARQSGKSRCLSGLVLREALFRPCSLCLILAPSQRQAGELFRDKFLPMYNALGRPVPPAYPRDNALQLVLANGSRVVALPGKADTVVCYSGVRILAIDEAARVPDDLYKAVRPMLAVSDGLLAASSTPKGKRGWFYEEWEKGQGWDRVRKTAADCPRISAEFLEEERATYGDAYYRQEYETQFNALVDSVFREEDIDAACAGTMPPLFGG